MDRGLYLAASGMLAEQVRQNQIANDLANASTPGYKADRTTQQSFGQLLLTNPQKGGNNLVTGTPGRPAGQVAGQVRSGALEGSGADPTQAMVDMIASMRAYESGQKVIQTIDSTLGKASTEVGKTA